MWITARNKLTPAVETRLPDGLRGRFLLGFTLCLALGIAVSQFLQSWGGGTVLPPAMVAIYLLCEKKIRPALLLFGVALGALLFCCQTARLDAWPGQAGETVTVEGLTLCAARPMGDGWRLTLQVQELNNSPLRCGPLYLYGEGPAPPARSHLRLSGQVLDNSGYGNANAFDYSQYLRHQGIAASISTRYGGQIVLVQAGPSLSPAQLGAWLRQAIDSAATSVPEQQRALIYGVYLGDDSALNEGLQSALGLAGMLHAFAVSGLHIGYIVLIGALLGGRAYRKRRRTALLTLGLLLLYFLLVGANASVCRAMLMALCLLAGRVLDEKSDPPTALAASALLCLIWKPLWLLDSGFQLSYATFSGMLLLGPPLRQQLRQARLPGSAANTLAVTISATLFALPTVAYYFYYISLWGWLLSPLVVLAAGLAVAAGLAATLLAPWLSAGAGLLLEAGGWVLTVPATLAEWLSTRPGAAWWTGALPAWYVLSFYGLLLVLGSNSRRLGRRLLPALLLATTLFALTPQLGWFSPGLSQEESRVVFLDVGQGDATLLQTADGKVVLIDGGGSASGNTDVGRLALLPYLNSQGIRHIDLLISTHPDADHIQGLLTAMAELDVSAVAWAEVAENNALQQQLEKATVAEQAQINLLHAGQRCQIGRELVFSVLSPGSVGSGDSNRDSLVLSVSCQGVTILFPGDADGEAIERLPAKAVQADILKLAHHGSGDSYTEAFYRRVDPAAVIISVGAGNSYGHPAQNVVDYWQNKVALYRTDRDGGITLRIREGSYSLSAAGERAEEKP